MATARQAPSYQRKAIETCLAAWPSTAAIHAVVASAAVEAKLAAFDAADATAIAEQRRYRWWGRLGLWATTLGTLVGALLLLPLAFIVDARTRTVVGGLQTLALAVTFAAMLLIRWLRPLDQWMQHRAEAERLRGEIFAAILAVPAPAGANAGELAAHRLALIETAHIGHQLDYFDSSIRRHAKAAAEYSPLRLVSYALIAAAAVIGIATLIKGLGLAVPEVVTRVVDTIVQPDVNRWQLGLATIASSMLAHAAARSLMDQDERNALLYRVTAGKVRGILAADLEPARAAAAKGDEAAVGRLFTTVRAVLEQEHAVWFYARAAADQSRSEI